MQARNAAKRALVRVFGYHHFLVIVFYYRYISALLRGDRSEIGWLRKVIRPNQLVFDVGANIGYTAALFANVASRGVYAFEPDADNFACLTRTLKRRKNVSAVRCGIGAQDGSAELQSVFADGVKQHALSRLRPARTAGDNRESAIPLRSIDTLRRELGSAIGFIKIDVEGFEVEVLRGMAETVAQDAPTLYVELCGEAALREYTALAAKYDYVVYSWTRGTFSRIDALIANGNYLFTRDDCPLLASRR